MKSFVLSALFVFFFSNNLILTILVTLKEGLIEGGLEFKSRNGNKFYAFYGIRYAKPPIGERRFQTPQELDPWEGVKYTRTPPPMCIQVYSRSPTASREVIGQEDCLYLNVYTPDVHSPNLLPVMVHIPGGAFQLGGTTYDDPQYLMDEPIVFVGMTYRHGILGFLSTEDEVLPGNIGMKDQVAALKWVRRNIAAFGGDPNRVTIAGLSSGGMSVYLHMHSPLSAGLFHRAMCISGTALTLGVIVPSHIAKQRALAVGTLSGCYELETRKLVECLRKVLDIYPKYPFAVVVEPENVPGAFLVKNPWLQDVLNPVPLYMGLNADEGCIFITRFLSHPALMEELNREHERLFPVVFQYANLMDPKVAHLVTESLRKFYFDDEDINGNNAEKLTKLISDADYVFASVEAARRYCKTRANMPIYFYLYDHRNVHSTSEIYGNNSENYGVCHADNFISLFYLSGKFPAVTEGPDLAVSKRLVKYTVNFMYYGDPNGNTQAEKRWLPVRSSNVEYLHIRTDSDTMEEKLFYLRYQFWRNIISTTIPHYYPNEDTRKSSNIVEENFFCFNSERSHEEKS